MRRYPHQLSGGMQQRVVIAMALAKDPTLLILDEPTTGLDATVEAEVLDLVVGAARASSARRVLFISHNLDVIAKMCDRVGVLYAGRLVEEGPVRRGLRRPAPPVHGRAAALPAARRRAQGPASGSTRSRASCRSSAPTCRRACSSTAAALAQDDLPQARSRRSTTSAAARHSRCHFWEQAHELPRATPAAGGAAAPVDAERRAGDPRRGHAQDVPPGGPRRPRASTTSRSSCAAARRSAWSASPAAARRRSRARCSASPRPTRARSSSSTGSRSRTRIDKRGARRGPRAADRLPEPRLGAQPALLGAPHPAAARSTKLRGDAQRRARGAPARARAVGALRRAPDQLAPGAALGRPQAARRDRARVRRRAARRRLRRADLGARRLGAGGDPQPARRAAGRARASPTSSSRTTSASCATSPTASPCSTSGG